MHLISWHNKNLSAQLVQKFGLVKLFQTFLICHQPKTRHSLNYFVSVWASFGHFQFAQYLYILQKLLRKKEILL